MKCLNLWNINIFRILYQSSYLTSLGLGETSEGTISGSSLIFI